MDSNFTDIVFYPKWNTPAAYTTAPYLENAAHKLISMFKNLKRGLITLLVCALASNANAQESDNQKQVSMELYGFAMMDAGHNYRQIDPDWFDVMRVTKLPASKNQFGADGFTYFSVRQTRFGVKGYLPTALGELKTIFEFEMFGTGVDAGQTTIRLRHAYGELGKVGAGQYWSPFMDIDVFPNSLEYWGPTGMAFFRNVQIRYMPIQGDSRLTFALERPGASSDQGVYAGRIELQGVRPKLDLPDFSAEYRHGRNWGYVELAGILRRLKWEDIDNVAPDLSDTKLGWGLNLSSGLKFLEKDLLHLSVVYGEGIQNYMNDAPADVAIERKDGNVVEGVALPVFGAVAFYDHYWNKKFSSTIGYSWVDIDNSNGQSANAFKRGDYGLVNLVYYPVDNVMVGAEFQYGKRKNHSDGWEVEGYKSQISFKYNFSQKFYRDTKTAP
ncbi:DcaP family trimeric outer membrane transporter [Chitinophagaceae bacterium LB-8]|uniref:DcaP family trimeric outer membrane transporter n=1 Tax=Paraflavisolibacter caeni TaxID=2982496 RepID=A0A9X2XVU5_9BACT|nr:DcaP family trimeric outer membrane transporter [Paraflavisolibacter caeni]MCU7549392.1 DcaP family trimeric outer membrane transporter [Paraflavisolibacter caeni]